MLRQFNSHFVDPRTTPSKNHIYMENGNIAAASPEEVRRSPAFGWAARDTSGVLSPFTFSRRSDSAAHEVTPLLSLLKTFGQMVMVGAPEKPLEIYAFPLLLGGKSIVGSAIGGMKETQEMIDFAAEHNVTADIELISMDYVNKAMERVAKADVRYRFVIDIGNTLSAA
ncbi:hypothetical protein ZIOFF_034342 [Zingiber officinale]|uniref:Alcohol dehydrogenase-like C-terminal domain-containing protein n=1 Tax=Zingiber officinale TaxID=94328 RepID=A0A8J5GRN6_ZINOF|nr:hypothetical protein ZIOFF_034342 [Zingiber officinale]